jgi:DNA-binding transcriptional ArsR family regulator
MQLWKLVGNPDRRRLYKRILLSGEPVSAKQASREPGAPPPQNVGYHMRVLREANAVRLVNKESRRGAHEYFYSPTRKFDRQRVLTLIGELDGETGPEPERDRP